MRKLKRHVIYPIVLLVVVLLGLLVWYKWPVDFSIYEDKQIDVNLLYYDQTEKATNVSHLVSKNEDAEKELFTMVKDVRFYKKIIQPSSAKSYSGHTGEIQIRLYTTQNSESVFVLDLFSDGTIRIATPDSRGYAEYGTSWEKNSGLKLYKKLYQFYQNAQTDPNWQRAIA